MTTNAPSSTRPEDEYLGLGRTLSYGVQHILAMFGGVIAVPIIIGGAAGLTEAEKAVLIASGLFISGLATILQTIGIPFFGSQLPLVQGTSFAAVSTMTTIVGNDGTEGLRTVFGSVIVAGVIGLVIAPFFAKIIRLFPPVVTGSIITVIGLSLMPVAAGWITGKKMIAGAGGGMVENPNFASMSNIALAMATFVIVIILSKIAKLSRVAVLLGLLIGTIIAFIVGKGSTKGVSDAKIFALPNPLEFGTPVFAVGAIVSMTVAIIVIMVETTADILAVGEVVETKVDSRRVGDGLRADMASTIVAPLFNSFPATAFAQNVGLVALTGIKSRFAVAAGGGLLLILGLSPVAASIFNMIPGPVLGGAGIVLFGTVAASGIRTLSKVDYQGNNNLIIVASAMAFGLIPVVATEFWNAFPDWFVVIFHSGISAAAIVAVILNLLFNVVSPGRPEDPTDLSAAPALRVQDEELDALEAGKTIDSTEPKPSAS